MYENEEYLEEDFIIWNGTLGVRDFVTIGEVEKNSDSIDAWLEEPYDMVGPFCLDDLIENGEISFAACVVMSEQMWLKNRRVLQEEAFIKQQKLQREFYEDINRHNQRRRQMQEDSLHMSEREHRELLSLPIEGVLEEYEIKSAFKKVAKVAHPDMGGSHEGFIKITNARDCLLERYTLY